MIAWHVEFLRGQIPLLVGPDALLLTQKKSKRRGCFNHLVVLIRVRRPMSYRSSPICTRPSLPGASGPRIPEKLSDTACRIAKVSALLKTVPAARKN